MATLADIRRQYPQYADMSDQALADALYRKHYSDMPRAEFDRRMGVSAPRATKKTSGVDRAAADFARKRREAGNNPEDGGFGAHVLQGAAFGWGDEIVGGVNKLETMARNAGRRLVGKPIPYTSDDAYEGARRVFNGELAAYDRSNGPVKGAVVEMAAGAANGKLGTGYMARGAGLVDQARRAARVGAAYGAAAGAGYAKDDERLKGAVEGMGVGALVGGALPPAVAAAKGVVKSAPRIVAGGREAAARVGQAVGAGAKEAKITPGSTARAEEIVREIVDRRGVSADSLGREVIAYGNKPITGAELAGREAQTLLMALGRRSGRTGDQLGELIRGRNETAPARVVADLERGAGRRPKSQFDDMENARIQMWKDAEPFYQAAYDFGPIGSPTIDKLLARPSLKEAMRRAYAVVREQGQDPETLGLVNVDNMDDWLTAVPTVDKALERASKVLDRGATPRGVNAGRGRTLVDWIAHNGGIVDDGGELARMDAQLWHRDKPYRRKLIADPALALKDHGLRPDTADGWAMRAWEEGYFPELRERPTPRQLFDAIEEELRGNPRYARDVDPAVADRLRLLDQAEERLQRGDPFDYPEEADYVGRPEPQAEPAHTFQPTMQSLDYMKRQLDDMLEEYRDPITRVLRLDEKGRAIAQTLQELKGELTRLNPRYAEALQKGGEAPRLELAWRDGPKLFSNEISEREFFKRWGQMSRADRKAAIGSWMDDLLRRARGGKLRIKELTQPAMRAKLEVALGRERTGWFLSRVDMENRLAAGSRMSPTANSPTAEVLQAQRELDQGTGFMADLQRRADAGQGPISAIAGAAAQTLASPFAGFVRGVQSPYGQAVRDELGRILMDPAETLRVVRSRPAPAPRPPAGYPPARIVAPAAAAGVNGR